MGVALVALVTPQARGEQRRPNPEVTWRCEVVYQPARQVWPREVRIAYNQRRVLAVAIDGVPVYTFAVRETTLLTALDNERVQFDTAAGSWSSDFRGLAQGAGRCERLP
ncbi:MAG: hypothetical protein RJA09_973 [Pseudomonadota bacterium]|jgi:hypothetical protein